MNVRLALALFAVALLGSLASCSSQDADAPPRRTLVLTGSSTVAPLAAEIGKRFESLHPGVRVDVQTGGSSRGVADAREGTADIGMVSRDLKPAESDLLRFTIARDGVSLIVHKDNPIKALTDADVVAIYTGKVQRWSEVGGKDAPITVINKAEGHSTLGLFLHHFGLKAMDIKADVVIGDNEQGIKTVAGNPDALGYVSIGSAEYDAEHGIPIRLLGLGGVEASIQSVQEGRFPLARPLNLVTRQQPEGLAAEFIDFARSPDVHDIVRAQYFVPLSSGLASRAAEPEAHTVQ